MWPEDPVLPLNKNKYGSILFTERLEINDGEKLSLLSAQ